MVSTNRQGIGDACRCQSFLLHLMTFTNEIGGIFMQSGKQSLRLRVAGATVGVMLGVAFAPTGCAYDPATGAYTLTPEGMELISNLAVSALARGDKELVMREEAIAAAGDAQPMKMASDDYIEVGDHAWSPMLPPQPAGAYTCGEDQVWLAAFYTDVAFEKNAIRDQVAAWIVARYAADNSLRWDGTPYQAPLARDGSESLVLVTYNAATDAAGWVAVHGSKSLATLTNDGTRVGFDDPDPRLPSWTINGQSCSVDVSAARSTSGAVTFWFD